jgi:hypothetical protein
MLNQRRRSRDQKQSSPDEHYANSARETLPAGRQTFQGDGYRYDSHRTQIHNTDYQWNDHQVPTTGAALKSQAQPMSQGRPGARR